MLQHPEFLNCYVGSRSASVLTRLVSQCVDQVELEKFDGVSTGKYTIGLGLTKMSFCDDREGKMGV